MDAFCLYLLMSVLRSDKKLGENLLVHLHERGSFLGLVRQSLVGEQL